MINLISINIEGFGSVIKPIKYKILNPGLNKIEGPNGAGKTTITGALTWVLYGQLVKPRKSSFIPWPHIIDENYHGTKVSLKFSLGKDYYKIIRLSDYDGLVLGKKRKNGIIITKNGSEIKDKGLRDKKDYQKWIIKKIGYSFELFKSTVLFTQELDNLMKEDGPTKKRIFDEAFETMFVNRAREKVEDRLKAVEGELVMVNNKIDVKEERLKGIRGKIKIANDNVKNWEKRKDEAIKHYKEKLERIRGNWNRKNGELIESLPILDEIKKLQRRLKKYDNVRHEEFRIDMLINGNGEKMEQLENKYAVLKEAYMKPKKKCSECGQIIPPEFRIQHKKDIKKKMDVVKEDIRGLETVLKDYTDQYVDLKAKMQRKEDLEKSIGKLKTQTLSLDLINEQIAQFLREIKDVEDEILKWTTQTEPKNNLILFRAERNLIKRELKALTNHRDDVEKEKVIDKWLIKDPLSNSGLKAFIFDSMMGKVNNYLQQYTPIIGFGIKVFIDMSSANKDIRILIERKGDEVPYEDLSKGQKQLVHVALAFSLSDSVQSIKPINAIFLDELFESLNTENVEKVGNIIIKKAQTKCVHLITHQTTFAPSNCHTTYVALNDKGQTYIH